MTNIDLPTFTTEQLEALKAYMIEQGKRRADTLGADSHEADFLAGCMTVFFALDQQNMCADWIFGLMGGESPLGVKRRDQTVYAAFNPNYSRDDRAVTLYVRKDNAIEHVEYLNNKNHGTTGVRYLELPLRHELHPRIAAALEETNA